MGARKHSVRRRWEEGRVHFSRISETSTAPCCNLATAWKHWMVRIAAASQGRCSGKVRPAVRESKPNEGRPALYSFQSG